MATLGKSVAVALGLVSAEGGAIIINAIEILRPRTPDPVCIFGDGVLNDPTNRV